MGERRVSATAHTPPPGSPGAWAPGFLQLLVVITGLSRGEKQQAVTLNWEGRGACCPASLGWDASAAAACASGGGVRRQVEPQPFPFKEVVLM
jgi:hypothetical protein